MKQRTATRAAARQRKTRKRLDSVIMKRMGIATPDLSAGLRRNLAYRDAECVENHIGHEGTA
jgi:hypothetical protein